MKSQGITKDTAIYPEKYMDVITILIYKSCPDTSLKNTNDNLMVAQDKRSGKIRIYCLGIMILCRFIFTSL